MDVLGDLGFPGRRPGLAGRSGLGGAGPIFRTILSQPDRNLVLAQWDKARDELAARYPKAPALMDAAKAEVAMQTSRTLGLYPPTPAGATQNDPALSVVNGWSNVSGNKIMMEVEQFDTVLAGAGSMSAPRFVSSTPRRASRW